VYFKKLGYNSEEDQRLTRLRDLSVTMLTMESPKISMADTNFRRLKLSHSDDSSYTPSDLSVGNFFRPNGRPGSRGGYVKRTPGFNIEGWSLPGNRNFLLKGLGKPDLEHPNSQEVGSDTGLQVTEGSICQCLEICFDEWVMFWGYLYTLPESMFQSVERDQCELEVPDYNPWGKFH
jgi:hypothetical protein